MNLISVQSIIVVPPVKDIHVAWNQFIYLLLLNHIFTIAFFSKPNLYAIFVYKLEIISKSFVKRLNFLLYLINVSFFCVMSVGKEELSTF